MNTPTRVCIRLTAETATRRIRAINLPYRLILAIYHSINHDVKKVCKKYILWLQNIKQLGKTLGHYEFRYSIGEILYHHNQSSRQCIIQLMHIVEITITICYGLLDTNDTYYLMLHCPKQNIGDINHGAVPYKNL